MNAFSQKHLERVNRRLDEILPPATASPTQLHSAMRYVVCQGGKRFRPLLVYATGEGLKAPLEALDRAACAIELIHAYSLTHDDLPAMDNDDMRRGQPSCHKAFDEATAILVGDALQSLAFEILSEGENAPPQSLAIIHTLAKASGSRGMVGGQSLDLLAAHGPLDPAQLHQIHQLKTGALIVASIQLGALAAPACDPLIFEQLSALASELGLAYQIQDDIFDYQEEKDSETQPCFVSTLGLDHSHSLLSQLKQSIQEHLNHFEPAMTALNTVYQSIATRHY